MEASFRNEEGVNLTRLDRGADRDEGLKSNSMFLFINFL